MLFCILSFKALCLLSFENRQSSEVTRHIFHLTYFKIHMCYTNETMYLTV
jgi:hypothetical protein